MSTIRPYNPPQIQTPASAPKRSTAEAKAAQRAFFQQAMGDVTPVRVAPTTLAATQAQAARNVQRPIPAEPPEHALRPGSFIDIKV